MPNKYGKQLPIRQRGGVTSRDNMGAKQALAKAMLNYQGPKVELPMNGVGTANPNYETVGTPSGGKTMLDNTAGRRDSAAQRLKAALGKARKAL